MAKEAVKPVFGQASLGPSATSKPFETVPSTPKTPSKIQGLSDVDLARMFEECIKITTGNVSSI